MAISKVVSRVVILAAEYFLGAEIERVCHDIVNVICSLGFLGQCGYCM